MKFLFNNTFGRRAAWTIGAPLLIVAQLSFAADDVHFTADTAYPEGVAWSSQHKAFLVSSVRHGTVGLVTMKGRYTPFIADDKLVASAGLALDTKRNTLWVAITDPGAAARSSPATQGKLAAVAAYNATTGTRIAYFDLGKLFAGSHFANDLTLDTQGNVYVTDSFSPVIYRIDTSGKATVFAQSDRFKGENFNLNGIVAHPNGYLLVNKHNSGELFRISIADPTQIELVALPETLNGADGMVLREAGRITLVQNSGADRAIDLVSTDGWKSATITRVEKSVLTFPTTATKVGNKLFIMNSRLDSLLTPGAPKVSNFVLQKY